MSFSKIAQIALYVVVAVSVLVIGLFYFGDSLIDTRAYEAKVEKLTAPDDMTQGFNFQSDMMQDAPADTTITEEGDTIIEAAPAPPPVMEEPAEEVEVSFTFMERLVFNSTDIALVWAYILVIVTLIVALVFSLVFMFSNTRALIRGLGVLAGAALLVFLAWMLGSEVPLDIIGYEGTDNKDPQVLRMVDMGLISTYFVLGLILLSILYSEIAKYFK